MKIFSVRHEVKIYQSIALDDDSIWSTRMLDFDCISKIETWKPPLVYITNPREKRGNFFYLTPSALVFDKKAFEKLRSFFEWSGEILTVHCEDEDDLYLLNCMDCVNCLNKKETTWRFSDDGVKLGIVKYVFHRNRMEETPLFKIPETSKGEILTFSGMKNPDDEFITAYQKAGLSGLLFTMRWSDED